MKSLDKNEGPSARPVQSIAITGVYGYVGRQLASALTARGFKVKGICRSVRTWADPALHGVDLAEVDYFDESSLGSALANCESIIHLAGTAHTRKHAADESVYRRSILDVTKAVYAAAQSQGCKKFIFASSIKVYGSSSGADVLDEVSECRPSDPYGRFKRLSEEYLQQHTGSETTAITFRFPPIYGGNTANSLKYLFWAAAHGIPLPTANLNNRRSILSIDNLINFMVAACTGKLTNSLYVLHDMNSLTVSDIYALLWRSYQGTDIPSWLSIGFPEFLKPYASRKGPLAPLLLPFELQSKYIHDFNKLCILDTATALKTAVDSERTI
jgi:UDP-glucose 4-epimerase